MGLFKKNSDYQKLPGKGSSLFGTSTLWLGSDHLLVVDRSGYTESYRRLDYQDIQAVIVRRNRHRLFQNLVLMTPLPILALVAFRYEEAGWIIASPFAALLVLILALNTLGGPACKCKLQTAVSSIDLNSLQRVNHVRKFLARIEPFIEKVQGPRLVPTPVSPSAGPPPPAVPAPPPAVDA